MLLATHPASMTRCFPNGRIDLTIDASMGRVAIFIFTYIYIYLYILYIILYSAPQDSFERLRTSSRRWFSEPLVARRRSKCLRLPCGAFETTGSERVRGAKQISIFLHDTKMNHNIVTCWSGCYNAPQTLFFALIAQQVFNFILVLFTLCSVCPMLQRLHFN